MDRKSMLFSVSLNRERADYEHKKRLIAIAFIAIAFATSLVRPTELDAPLHIPVVFDAVPVKVASALTVEDHVALYFADIPVMQDIAWCESKFRQHNSDGSVLRGEMVPADTGVMQINEYYHAETAKKLNLDLHTLEGNLKYARYLYEEQGTKPWNSSRACWEKRQLARK